MFSTLFPSLSLVLLLLNHAASQRIKPNVNYQIHSNNDLREFPQVLLKGARGFKFDPHYVEFNTVCPNDEPCFILSHDDPLPFHDEYNTSSDLLSYLVSEEFGYYSNNELVTIALCFKSAPDKCDSTSTKFNHWLELVDNFYEEFQAANIPNVVILLDGDGKPENCLIGRWPAWNAVWITTPEDAFYSNAAENDYYRFVTLNDNENLANWEWMATPEVNYGKFSNMSSPYQLWEPDAQEDIIEYINIYRSGHEHAEGFHFAINSDIAMFRVYSSSESNNTGIDTAVGMNKLVAQAASKPFIVQISSSAYLAVFQDETGNIATTSIHANETAFTATFPTAAETLPTAWTAWLLEGGDDCLVSVVSLAIDDVGSGRAQVMLTTRLGKLLVLSISYDNENGIIPIDESTQTWRGQLEIDSELCDSDPISASAAESVVSDVVSADVASENLAGPYTVVFLVLTSDLRTLTAVAAQLSFGGALLVNVMTCINTELSVTSDIDNARLASLGNALDGHQMKTQNEKEYHFILFASTANTIVGRELQLVESTSALSSTAVFALPFSSSWITITVGSGIAVSFSPLNNVLLLLNDGGYCYNSHKHNTRSLPSVCSSPPVPTPYVLDYTLGLVEDWQSALRKSDCLFTSAVSGTSASSTDSSSSSNGLKREKKACYMASPCDARILHGTYDQGSKPTVAVSRFAMNSNTGSGSDAAFFLSLHEGYSLNERHGGGCGEPIHRDGVVLDSFDISEWVEALTR